MRLPRALGALEAPRFRLLFAAQATSVLGDNIAPIALAFAVIGLGGSAVDLGLVLAARAVPMALLVVPAGVVADRFGRHRALIASDLVSFAAQAGLAAVLLAGDARLWQVIAFQAVYGTAAAVFLPASSGLVPETVPPERLQEANSLVYFAFGLAGVAGPVIAGVLVSMSSPGWAIAADALTFAASASILSRLHISKPALGAARSSFRTDLALGWREVRSRSWLLVSIADFGLFAFFVFGCFFVLGPVIAEESLGGAGSWAAVVAMFGLGAVLGSVIASHVRPARPLVATFCASLAFSPALALLAVPAAVPVLAVGWAGAGIALGFGGVIWETTLQERIPSEVRSRVSAYDWLGSLVMRPLGYAAIGPLAALIGSDRALWLAAGALAVFTSATLCLPAIRRIERLPQSGRAEPARTLPA
jgi:MFS family permease